jgi:hypothetical protein
MSNFYRGPSKDAAYQVSIHLAKRLQRRRFFRNQPIRNKNCLWWPCLLTDREEMSNLHRGPAIDHGVASNQFLSVNISAIRLLSVITTTPSSKNNVILINTGPSFRH